jgi:hypothetical protein
MPRSQAYVERTKSPEREHFRPTHWRDETVRRFRYEPPPMLPTFSLYDSALAAAEATRSVALNSLIPTDQQWGPPVRENGPIYHVADDDGYFSARHRTPARVVHRHGQDYVVTPRRERAPVEYEDVEPRRRVVMVKPQRVVEAIPYGYDAPLERTKRRETPSRGNGWRLDLDMTEMSETTPNEWSGKKSRRAEPLELNAQEECGYIVGQRSKTRADHAQSPTESYVVGARVKHSPSKSRPQQGVVAEHRSHRRSSSRRREDETEEQYRARRREEKEERRRTFY